MAWKLLELHLGLVMVLFVLTCVHAITEPKDVTALNSLYISLEEPAQLTLWNSSGGDPCGGGWLGVICTGSNVTELHLNQKGLSGNLGYSLTALQQLLILDVSGNNIQGNMPSQLPPLVRLLNLGGNVITGNIPHSLKELTNLTELNLSHNKLQNGVPDVWTQLTSLRLLDLSFNELTGSLPRSIGDLSALTSLNVENNHLTGNLPLSMSNLTNLQYLNLQNNRFTGWLPPNLNPRDVRISGNNFSNQPAPPPPPYTPPPPRQPAPRRIPPPLRQRTPAAAVESSEKSGFWTGGRIAGVAVVVLLLFAAAILCFLYVSWRRRGERGVRDNAGRKHSWLQPIFFKEKSVQSNQSFGDLGVTEASGEKIASPQEMRKNASPMKTQELKAPPSFKSNGENGPSKTPPSRPPPARSAKAIVPAIAYSVADLQAATNSFAQENLIGEGSLGRVYRGEFTDGQVHAVKKLDSSSPLVQNEQDFLGILSGMARLRHGNITELVGYCAEHGQRLLVYQYISRGTLNDILHTKDEDTKRLTWNARVKIALGAARALEYLHEVCLPAVVHRNFKSANVLLDDELNPHLTDCGIAALTPLGSDRQVSTQMLGSFGYSAPEYAMSGIYTVKSDVYSFGVVMLELLTGRKPLDSTRLRAEQSLVRWATPQLHDIDALAKMVDPALKGIYPAKSLSRFADIIALCVQPEPEFRPVMSEVVQALVRLMQRASLNKRRSGDDLGASNRSMDRQYDPSDSST
ncbi:protein STRUBBELIG-RECEPTOR FAMILY 8 isoform X2 [Physcomitrium patens]|uniref:Protein kinase domain-containing protein n=1 Tax=Physcomitrium patens TaxID=3218 RepID=A0A2K1IJA9_PHYPA|nr:protein STRUBBELIG-RECEPTOR FAMILY 8-like isoform X2 [Physcomitrium patens]XP_024361881.1 protein STRUBBELIG-RECEPTOR FAMILY 8-like isoform X2 [Physcomitrium patens]PNR29360.1 hypothetical protein PHYPA_028053 [Physcomitrium patens]|eukprot:XP_024361880.1 protein STRUBBELIG-RECEPTOR FAMILY 8-like isoform X2 [Physcomitrella patens]